MNHLFRAFHQAENNFFSLISDNKKDTNNLVAFRSGVPTSNLNPALVYQLSDTMPTSLDACKLFYAEQSVPWALVIPEYLCNQAVETLLQKHHFNFEDQGVAMSLVLEASQPYALNTSLQIKLMEDDLITWSIPLLHGFESVPEITDVYTNRHKIACKNHADMYHFSGFINDRVVCSLSVSVCEQKARLDDIATMPCHQKNGYASTLIDAALKFIAQKNMNTCFLEASSDGLSLYKKIGFKELFINRYYEVAL